MDRGTIVIRVNKQGVQFLTFDPGKRNEAKIFVAALFASGKEDPFICVNLQEMTEEMDALHARIDELMMEWCPDEMTQEQIDNYAKNQAQHEG